MLIFSFFRILLRFMPSANATKPSIEIMHLNTTISVSRPSSRFFPRPVKIGVVI